MAFPRGTDPAIGSQSNVALFLQHSTWGLIHCSSCLCINPPPPESPESTGLLCCLATSVSPYPKLCTQMSPAWPRTPAPAAEDSWHPGVVLAVHQLWIFFRDNQEATFTLRRVMSSQECRSQHTEVHQDEIRNHMCPKQTAAPKQPKHLFSFPWRHNTSEIYTYFHFFHAQQLA